MVIRHWLHAFAATILVNLLACGGGSNRPSTSVDTAPAPTVDVPAPAADVKLYPPPPPPVDDYNGLTQGCGTRIGVHTPSGFRKLPDVVTLPQVQFDNLGRSSLLRDLDIRPSRSIPYYIRKTPLAILPGSRSRVTLEISAANAKVGFIYRAADLAALGGRYRLPKDASRITFPVCRYDDRPAVAVWAGGVVFDRPTCARIDLIGADERVEASVRVRLLVPNC